MNSDNLSCERNSENEENLNNEQLGNGFDTDELPKQDIQVETTRSSEDKGNKVTDFKNDSLEEQTELQIITNESEFHEDCKIAKEELSNNNSLCPNIHIERENLEKTEYLGGEVETEKTYENHVDHVEIENYEDEANTSQFSENESQMEESLRSGTDSKHEIYVDSEENSENLENLLEENTLDSNNSHRNQFSISDDDSQYVTKHLLDVKEIKVLHECSLCQYSTTHLGILQKHISTKHRGRKIWKCKHCTKKFTSKDSLHKHVYKDHTKRPRKCPFCLCILVCSGKIMKNHISDMHSLECLPPVCPDRNKLELDGLTRKGPRGTYKCKNCSYSNRCLNTMLTHAKLHTRKHVLKCLFCHYLTNQQKLYISHLSNAHKLAKHIHVCSRCFFQSDDYIEYVEHSQQPHSYHNCELCDFKTYYVENFYLHVDNHECSNCDNAIENQEELSNNSVSLKQNEVMESQHSKILDFNSDDATELATNVKDVTEQKDEITTYEYNNVHCPKLENRRKIKKGLREYYAQSKVNGVLTFKCLKCDFVSKFNSNYEICEHIVNEHSTCSKKSEGPNPIQCTNVVEIVEIENENSPANRYVIEPRDTHLKTQDDNRKNSSFICQQCGWAASTLHERIVHEQKMHNMTNFKCPTCSFETSDESALIDHFENHPESKRQILCCPFCELEVENEICLKSHVDIEHLNLIEEGDEDIIKQKLLVDDLHKASDETCSATKEFEVDALYRCDFCPFNTFDFDAFESHKKTHLNLICPRCFLDQFSSEEEFWEHVNQHCHQCNFYSNDPNKLKLHVLAHVPKYRRRKADDSTTISKRLLDVESEPVENIEIIMDDETNRWGDVNEIDQENIHSEEIRIIFEDFCEEDDSSELYSYENGETGIIKESNDDKNKSRLKRRRVKKADESSVTRTECESRRTSDVEKDKKYRGKPVRIIKLVQFQCFDCLNIYKTRYTLVDHRKRMHGLKKPHSCTYCMEIFESYSLLKSHYYRVHKVSFHYRGAIFKCPLCEFNSMYLKKTFRHVEDVHERRVVGFHKGSVI